MKVPKEITIDGHGVGNFMCNCNAGGLKYCACVTLDEETGPLVQSVDGIATIGSDSCDDVKRPKVIN